MRLLEVPGVVERLQKMLLKTMEGNSLMFYTNVAMCTMMRWNSNKSHWLTMLFFHKTHLEWLNLRDNRQEKWPWQRLLRAQNQASVSIVNDNIVWNKSLITFTSCNAIGQKSLKHCNMNFYFSQRFQCIRHFGLYHSPLNPGGTDLYAIYNHLL